MPAELPRLRDRDLAALREAEGFVPRAQFLARLLLGDEYEGFVLDRVVRDAFDFPAPLRRAGRRRRILELYRGPTCAFKDFGARFLARIMAESRSPDVIATILAATSGDTGAAAARAFHGVPGMRAAILFPKGRISDRQEAQMTSPGGNILAVAVRGSFDDCQRLARQALADEELCEAAGLTTANSINPGRILPQCFYYAHAWAELARKDAERPQIFVVPSGNFGNLCAGVMARRMGIPIAGLVAATNANATVPRFLEGGRYEPRAPVATISSAMDVSRPSNFARIRELLGSDAAARREIKAYAFTDDETRAGIRELWEERRILLDPHSAVGFLGLKVALKARRECLGTLLATAHPAKFPEVVEPIIGKRICPPPALRRALRARKRPVVLSPDAGALRELLLGESRSILARAGGGEWIR